MAYHDDLKRSLIAWLGKDKVVFMPGWDKKQRGIDWPSNRNRPVALVCHHTAGAATSSTNPDHPGNQRGANKGQITYVAEHFSAPASNFTLDRDGTVYVNSAYPCWHCGEGSFRGVKPFNTLGVPDDRGHDFMLGVEVVDRGSGKTFTSAVKWSLGRLANACQDASGWIGVKKRLPNHRTWAPDRKPDTRYSLASLRLWAFNAAASRPVLTARRLLSSTHTTSAPAYASLLAASLSGVATSGTYALAMRLKTLGFFTGSPRIGRQAYPRKAVQAWQKSKGYKATGLYGPKGHRMIFTGK